MIRPIDTWSVDQITSGQVVTSLSSAVKELVENSLDAGATVVEIKLINHGRDGFTVTDNGHGIDSEDFEFVAHKHATSKLQVFEDLSKVKTLGFRGEALASLCALADVIITTNTGTDGKGTELEFDNSGRVKSSKSVASPRGTIVNVCKLFEQLPVRRKTFERNSAREFTKTVELIQEYALLSSARITLEHISKNRSSPTLRSQGAKLIQRIACIYGAKRTKSLQPIEIEGPENKWQVSGFISKPIFGMGDSANTCQLLAINSRPTQQVRLQRAVVEVYKQFNLTEQPFFVFDIKVSPELYDINVSPDKRSLLLHNEDGLIAEFRSLLEDVLNETEHSVPRSDREVNYPPAKKPKQSLLSFAAYSGSGSVIDQGQERQSNLPEPDNEEEPEDEDEYEGENEDNQEQAGNQDEQMHNVSENRVVAEPPRLSEGRLGMVHHLDPRYSVTLVDESEDNYHEATVENSEENPTNNEVDDEAGPEDTGPDEAEFGENDMEVAKETSEEDNYDEEGDEAESTPNTPTEDPGIQKNQVDVTVKEELPEDVRSFSSHHCNHTGNKHGESRESVYNSPQKSPQKLSQKPPKQTQQQNRAYLQRQKTLNTHIHLPLSISDVENSVEEAAQSSEKSMRRLQTLALDEDGVEERLQLSIRKQDFENMEVVGQFNLGFILVVNRKANHDDLFVIDQHASDEIFNFERLQTSTVLSRQPLVVPHVLELSAAEELTVQEHLSVFENNGFSILIKTENPPGRQCLLVSVPFSKSTVFDDKDVLELLSKLKEDPNQPRLRCSKLRSMFAMRACRSSIMIGTPLKMSTMQTVVRNMGTLDKPWNCPHGRPTLRHITTLS